MTNEKNIKKNNKRGNVNILYILFSVAASLALWLYVTYVDNPERDTYVTGIPVQFSGDDILLDNNLMVTGVNTNKLNIRFSGRWNALSKLDDSAISAEVDLSEIVSRYSSSAGTYMLSYTLKYADGVSGNGISVNNANYNYITVNVEKIVSVSIPVRGEYNGKLAEGFTAEAPRYSVDMITVSGPQAKVSQISYAWVTLNRENLSKSVSEDVPVVLMDENGKELDKEGLIISQDSVTVTLNVLMVKDIPLLVKLAGGSSADDSNTRYTIEPQSITLSGDPEILSEINHIQLGTIDLTKFTTATTESFAIPIPNDVNNLTGATSADVTVEVIGLSTTRLSTSNIQIKNLTDGYDVSIITQSLDVLVRGKETSIKIVSPENIRVVADLTELGNTTGKFSVSAKVYIDGVQSVDAIGDYKVTVDISKAQPDDGKPANAE